MTTKKSKAITPSPTFDGLPEPTAPLLPIFGRVKVDAVIDFQGEPLAARSFIRTPMNYVHRELITDVEIVDGVSITVPDQTYTIREQLDRFRGGSVHGLQGQFMEEDDDAPDFSKMDTIEIIQWREDALDRLEDVNERFRLASAELAKKQDEARIEAAVEARLKAVPIVEEPQP